MTVNNILDEEIAATHKLTISYSTVFGKLHSFNFMLLFGLCHEIIKNYLSILSLFSQFHI